MPRDQLSKLYALAQQLDLDVVFEVHDRRELDIALDLFPEIIGINNRDLTTFKTDLKTFESLVQFIPKETVRISESGVFGRDEMIQLQNYGADAALIGESIITNPNPYSKISALRGVSP